MYHIQDAYDDKDYDYYGYDLINSQPFQPNLSGRHYCERDRDGLALGGSGAQSYTLPWGGGSGFGHPTPCGGTIKLTRLQLTMFNLQSQSDSMQSRLCPATAYSITLTYYKPASSRGMEGLALQNDDFHPGRPPPPPFRRSWLHPRRSRLSVPRPPRVSAAVITRSQVI